ncbi:hypothetical protein A3H77_00220 [Candidatus Kaiserbacteria bacterium RIFCSPLOWO2_02_FULL_56_11]|uniref:Uncharacterized protein n=2 Tax=Candidatus Kaiseribacteriota TaxID=1752734 RepID=A0A1F6E1T7_9BACT|nr:MAG: hypothetical protein A3C95_00490 [Candidatus Kaiserbacteria bacterium RIFCSPHIGHO2_02_FULL_56_30]OGG72357.1 MAG: hypothetical protein A3E65_01490 [Candidatus Kaiserbacteria bacterium RIFCSPHIGHO2_12_FULL_56_13]OGG80831.1 MAG: hypothetical protein A3H77_00220 [Candidatus Kaiserbacteria bacterium RIFCSPLOWO2_02_FULL_56_11]
MNKPSQDQVVNAFNRLPEAIREYLSGPETGKVMTEIQKKYNLHVDTAGKVSECTGYLLLGLMSPAEMSSTLVTDAALQEEGVRQLMSEINQKIFVPLQARMRGGEEPVRVVPQVGVPSYQPPPKPLAPPLVRPVQPSPPLRPQAMPRPVPKPPPNLPGATPDHLLPDHEAEHIHVPTPQPPLNNLSNKLSGDRPQDGLAKPSAAYNVDPYREPIDEK